jgi:exonuclease SbcD
MGRPGIGLALNSRIQDQVNLLDWVFQQAVDNYVYSIFITGDIFDESKPHPTIIATLVDWLVKCSNHEIEVHILMGNHDVIRSGKFVQSALDIIEKSEIRNIHVYKDLTTVDYDGVSFSLLPFKDRRGMGKNTFEEVFQILGDKLYYEATKISNHSIKVLIGHLALEGSIPVGNEFDDLATEIHCPLSLFNNYDYVWMGHVHKPQVLQQKPYLAHVGSMDLSDFGEEGAKKHIILFDSESKDRFTEIVLPTRPLRRFKINVDVQKETTEFVLDYLKEKNTIESFNNAIVWLDMKLPGREAEPVDKDKVKEFIYNSGAFYICNCTESRAASIVSQIKQDEVDFTMDVHSALTVYSKKIKETQSLSDDEEREFLEEAKKVIEICNSK